MPSLTFLTRWMTSSDSIAQHCWQPKQQREQHTSHVPCEFRLLQQRKPACMQPGKTVTIAVTLDPPHSSLLSCALQRCWSNTCCESSLATAQHTTLPSQTTRLYNLLSPTASHTSSTCNSALSGCCPKEHVWQPTSQTFLLDPAATNNKEAHNLSLSGICSWQKLSRDLFAPPAAAAANLPAAPSSRPGTNKAGWTSQRKSHCSH